MTTFDKVSVFLYRSGILISVLSVWYGTWAAYRATSGAIEDQAIAPARLTAVFTVFFISTGVSITFLHLYSRQVLNIIRSFFVIAALILVPFAALHFSGRLLLDVLTSFIGVAGFGFLLAAFSGIGAKEAFCFRILEGYYYGSLFALLVFIQLISVLIGNPWSLPELKTGMLAIISILTLLFLIKKFRLPLYVDIGDKSRYG